MSMTTLASTGPRNAAVAMPAKKMPIAPHMMPNRAGQVAPAKLTGIVNSAMSMKARK